MLDFSAYRKAVGLGVAVIGNGYDNDNSYDFGTSLLICFLHVLCDLSRSGLKFRTSAIVDNQNDKGELLRFCHSWILRNGDNGWGSSWGGSLRRATAFVEPLQHGTIILTYDKTIETSYQCLGRTGFLSFQHEHNNAYTTKESPCRICIRLNSTTSNKSIGFHTQTI